MEPLLLRIETCGEAQATQVTALIKMSRNFEWESPLHFVVRFCCAFFFSERFFFCAILLCDFVVHICVQIYGNPSWEKMCASRSLREIRRVSRLATPRGFVDGRVLLCMEPVVSIEPVGRYRVHWAVRVTRRWDSEVESRRGQPQAPSRDEINEALTGLPGTRAPGPLNFLVGEFLARLVVVSWWKQLRG